MFNKLQMTHIHQNKLNWHLRGNLARTFSRCRNQEQMKLIECLRLYQIIYKCRTSLMIEKQSLERVEFPGTYQ